MPILQLNLVGRLGNTLFEYSHARAWCEQNNYDLCLHPWVGETVFSGVPLAIRPGRISADIVWSDRLFQHQRDLIYTRKQVREWFKFKPHIEAMLQPAKCKSPVVLNLRHGRDYRDAGLVTLSRTSVSDACRKFGYDPNLATWETDTDPLLLPEFKGDITASGLNTTAVGLPSFYRLMTAPVLFRANSSFSWWAATLSDGRIYSPVIKGLPGGTPDVYCADWVEGNWPRFVDSPDHSDLHLAE